MKKVSKKFANVNIFLYLCVVKAITTYEAITQQKLANQWSATLAMFPKAFTLDVYYHIYQAVEEYEPERTYGYRKRICANMQICSDLWGGGYLKKEETLSEIMVKHAIEAMELIVFV